MMIESEGVMQVSVTTAQKHPLPARGIAHTKRLGNSYFILQIGNEFMCVVATLNDNRDSSGPAF